MLDDILERRAPLQELFSEKIFLTGPYLSHPLGYFGGENRIELMNKKQRPNSQPATGQTDEPETSAPKKQTGEAVLHHLRTEREKLWLRPTPLQLAHLAANYELRGLVKPDGPNAAQQALALLHLCREELRQGIDAEIHCVMSGEWEDNDDPQETEYEDSALEFEDGLRSIIGKQTRRADRYKILRDAMRWAHGKFQLGDKESDEETWIAKRIGEWKAEGLNSMDVSLIKYIVRENRAGRAKEKARAAACKRWAQKRKDPGCATPSKKASREKKAGPAAPVAPLGNSPKPKPFACSE